MKLTYNAAGQRTSSETYGKLKYRHEETDIWNGSELPHIEHGFLKEDFTKEDYEYDRLGRLTKTYREAEEWKKRTNSSGQVLQNTTTQPRALISNHEYDKASRETKETTQGRPSRSSIAPMSRPATARKFIFVRVRRPDPKSRNDFFLSADDFERVQIFDFVLALRTNLCTPRPALIHRASLAHEKTVAQRANKSLTHEVFSAMHACRFCARSRRSHSAHA